MMLDKLGRNDSCFCGSGKKYKKCCKGSLKDEEYLANRRSESDTLLRRFAKYHPSHNIIRAEETGGYKMSEILLEFGKGLLNEDQTYEETCEALVICVTAWNLSWTEKNEREEILRDFLATTETVPSELAGFTMMHLIEELIIKRQTEYPFINRLIHDFSLTGNGSDVRLNVLSTSISLEEDLDCGA